MRVFLIGFMGSGKTTLGKSLANRLDFSFYDMDDLIVQRENSTIPEIFKIHGETYFRNSERSVIQGLEKCSNAVISTGGGAPCFYDNIDLMNELGKTIYLRIDPGILASRLIINQQKRPLIAGKSKEQLREFIENKLREREPFYLKAHHIIEGKNIKVSDLDPLFKENKS